MNPMRGDADRSRRAAASAGAVPKRAPPSREDSLRQREARVLADRGHEMLDTGRHSEAVELFTRAIERHPGEDRYYCDRAYAYCVLRLFQEALDDCDVAIRLRSRLPKYHIQRGRALFGLGRYRDAMESFQRALEHDPTSEDAQKEIHASKVQLLLGMDFNLNDAQRALTESGGNFEQAVDALRQPARVDPSTDPTNPNGSRSLLVRGISTEVTNDTLWRHFCSHGSLESVEVRHGQNCALVTFRRPASATAALTSMQGRVFCGQTMALRFVDPPSAAPGPPLRGSPEHFDAGAVGGQGGPAPPPLEAHTVRLTEAAECPSWKMHGWCKYGFNCHNMHLPHDHGID